jgi:DNA-binding GntR family transcriptional regulator
VPRGGVRVDQLLNVVAGAKGPIDINAIRAKIGGSPDQLRAALKRLAAAGQVKITGERRGTRYSAA